MLFVNISSDFVYLADSQKSIQIHRNVVDQDLGPELVKRHKQNPFSKIFVLNGPGGFTNLRVGTLILNLFKTLNSQLEIFTTTKLDIFSHFYKENILPQRGMIYIGQKQNLRHYNFATNEYQTIKKSDLPSLEQKKLFYDAVFEVEYYPKSAENSLVEIIMTDKLKIKFLTEDYDIPLDLFQRVDGNVKPEYMVQPVISCPKNS